MNRPLLFLLFAILSEIIGTSALKQSAGFSRIVPSAIVIIAYATTFYLLSLALKTIPVNVAYAMWAGLGTAGIAIVGWVFFREPLSGWSVLGMMLIIAGVVILNLSGMVKH